MENVLVVLIVALAGAYVFRASYRKWKGRDECKYRYGECTRLKKGALPEKNENSTS